MDYRNRLPLPPMVTVLNPFLAASPCRASVKATLRQSCTVRYSTAMRQQCRLLFLTLAGHFHTVFGEEGGCELDKGSVSFLWTRSSQFMSLYVFYYYRYIEQLLRQRLCRYNLWLWKLDAKPHMILLTRRHSYTVV